MSPIDLYIFLSRLVSVLTVVSYGMLSAWAVYSPWHWFWRVAVVGASLGALVALPGNNLLFPCAFAIPVFGIALAIWRPPARLEAEAIRRRWPRIALRDSFLLTLVVAAILTVVVNAPPKTPRAWAITFVDGLVLASMGLACAWVAIGRSNWMLRLAATPLVAVYCFFATPIWLMWYGRRLPSGPSRGRTFVQTLQADWSLFWRDGWGRWIEWIAPTAIGIIAFVGWLMLMRRTAWIAGRNESRDPAMTGARAQSRRTDRWRWSACGLSIAVALLPGYVWVRIVRPRPLPPEAFASNRGYEELVTLANEIYSMHGHDPNRWIQSSDAQYSTLVSADEALWQRLRTVIDIGVRFPWLTVQRNEREALSFLAYLMTIRASRGDGTGSVTPKITASLDLIRLSQMHLQAGGPYDGLFVAAQPEAAKVLARLRGQLSADQSREIIKALDAVERDREPSEQSLLRLRKIRESGGWEGRSDSVLAALAGIPDSYEQQERGFALYTRMLALELAIQLFERDYDRLPTSLEELVPMYLAQLPNDPFVEAPFKYQFQAAGYLLYSVGPDGIDNGGRRIIAREEYGDYPWDMIFPPPRPQPPQPTTNADASKAGSPATKAENN
jgi:hypothetical protein